MSIIVKYAGLSIKKNFTYRANGALVILDTLMDCFSVWLFWMSLMELDLQLTGWSNRSLQLFMGFSLISSSVSNLFVGAWDLESHVLEGTLDAYLVKPCSPMLLILLERASFLRFVVTFPIGFGLVAVQAGRAGLWDALLGTALCIGATVLVELLILAIYELVFWVKKVDSYAEIAETLCSISQYPLVLFEKKLALFFTYVIPVAFIGTVPMELITGGGSPRSLLALPVLAAGIVGLVCVLWNRGRKRYEPAN